MAGIRRGISVKLLLLFLTVSGIILIPSFELKYQSGDNSIISDAMKLLLPNTNSALHDNDHIPFDWGNYLSRNIPFITLEIVLLYVFRISDYSGPFAIPCINRLMIDLKIAYRAAV
jgi:hypothetical protein